MSRTRLVVRSVAVVLSEGRVLLVTAKATPDAWVPPGGKLEPREPAHECAAREVLEESGLAVEMGRLIAYREVWREDGDLLELYFAARPVACGEGLPATSGDGRSVRWLEVSRLSEMRHFPAELEALCRTASDDACALHYLGALDLRGEAT